MNFFLKTNFHLRSLTPFILAAALLGCDTSPEAEGDFPECTVTLTRSTSQTLNMTDTEILFTGDLSQSCVEKTSQESGTTQVKLSTQSEEANESVALKLLKAGSRSIAFDPESDNLKRGSFETSFTSSLLPEWSVPWQDRPQTISLSMIASPSSNPSSIPASVTVELNF